MTRPATLLFVFLLTLVAGDGFPPSLGPVASRAESSTLLVAPGFFDPAQRAGSAYKNVDPQYRRASYWTRLRCRSARPIWRPRATAHTPRP
jgi:hypothetical protein